MYTKLKSSFRNSRAEISDNLQWIFFSFSIFSTFDHNSIPYSVDRFVACLCFLTIHTWSGRAEEM